MQAHQAISLPEFSMVYFLLPHCQRNVQKMKEEIFFFFFYRPISSTSWMCLISVFHGLFNGFDFFMHEKWLKLQIYYSALRKTEPAALLRWLSLYYISLCKICVCTAASSVTGFTGCSDITGEVSHLFLPH